MTGAIIYQSLWAGMVGCLIGIGFLAYGFKRTPQYFNSLNPWQKPLPVWLARMLYLPIGVLCLFFGLCDLFHALR